MSEFVERVARAICGGEGSSCACPVGEICDWVLVQTLAAIAAMREPTDAMVRVGADASDIEPHRAEDDVREIWRAMIDAALAEPGQ